MQMKTEWLSQFLQSTGSATAIRSHFCALCRWSICHTHCANQVFGTRTHASSRRRSFSQARGGQPSRALSRSSSGTSWTQGGLPSGPTSSAARSGSSGPNQNSSRSPKNSTPSLSSISFLPPSLTTPPCSVRALSSLFLNYSVNAQLTLLFFQTSTTTTSRDNNWRWYQSSTSLSFDRCNKILTFFCTFPLINDVLQLLRSSGWVL